VRLAGTREIHQQPSSEYHEEIPMPHAFAAITFTPSVKALQEAAGSRAGYERAFGGTGTASNIEITDSEVKFLAQQRTFYMATISETGWPYVQHRGGPRGFLRVIDERTIGFADFDGNRQFISVGNSVGNNRVALIVVDYAAGRRLKILGRMEVRALTDPDPLMNALTDPTYKARPQRAILIAVEAYDWNCPQHIVPRFDADVIEKEFLARDARIAALEAQLRASGLTPEANVGDLAD
jgi:predicted pyridoxine 5'-phosphate oxidase superfamily flavin-nucleotide-binding protein